MSITHQTSLRHLGFGLLRLLVTCSLLAAACSSSSDDSSDASTATTGDSTESTGSDGETGAADGAENAHDASAGSTATTQDQSAVDADTSGDPDGSADDDDAVRGVTDETITLGYVYLNLDEVRERGLISLNWGPQGEHAHTIVDHINANGGINGRSIELITRAVDPIGATDARSACIELTEDTEVFAVFGTLRNDDVLCYTEQHDTIAVANGDLTQERLDRSVAPYASVNPARERIIDLFVAESVERGLFADRTIAVLSTDAADVAADIAIPALTDAGVTVDHEHLIRSDGTLGSAAVAVASSTEAMRAQDVDAVFIVGDAIVAVNTFIGAGFFPTLFFTDQGSATVTAGRADLSGFPAVYTYGPPSASERFQDPVFQQECAAPWDELNPDLAAVDPSTVPEGEPNHAVGLLAACRSVAVFTAIAEAAGPDLNNATFQAALDNLGEIYLPGTGSSVLGEGKYDTEDSLLLSIFNPDAAEDEPVFVKLDG